MATTQTGGRLKAKRFVFVLLPKFSVLSLSTALETLRIADRLGGGNVFEWVLCAEGGERPTSSLNTEFEVDTGLIDLSPRDTVLVVGGMDIQHNTSDTLVTWLQRQAHQGVPMGGLCTAAYSLAQAGLLQGKKATIHWEERDCFAEAFPCVSLVNSAIAIDGNRFSTAGGTSSIDLMLSLISSVRGEALANAVSEQLMYANIRIMHEESRMPLPTRIRVRHPKLALAVELMEKNLEDPLSPSELADLVGLSVRQLERLFQRELSRSPKRYYMDLRLARAKVLLTQTNMSIIDIGLACGFASPSYFSSCYRKQYHVSPRQLRK